MPASDRSRPMKSTILRLIFMKSNLVKHLILAAKQTCWESELAVGAAGNRSSQ